MNFGWRPKSGNPFVAGIEIPGIYRKFRLLIEYQHAAGWDDFAKHFGVAEGTVKGWGQGNAGQARDALPPRHLERFESLIKQALPGNAGPDRVREIVYGPALLLEQALRANAPAALDELLEAEADRGRIRLVRKPLQPNLIERERDGPERPVPSLALDAFFRIACDAPFPVRHAVALQQAQRLWGFVPAEIDPSMRRILLPGFKEDGSPDFMRERTQTGLHRFIVFQTADAIPIPIAPPDRAAVTLDPATLAGIVAFYRAQRETARHLYLLELKIGDPNERD